MHDCLGKRVSSTTGKLDLPDQKKIKVLNFCNLAFGCSMRSSNGQIRNCQSWLLITVHGHFLSNRLGLFCQVTIWPRKHKWKTPSQDKKNLPHWVELEILRNCACRWRLWNGLEKWKRNIFSKRKKTIWPLTSTLLLSLVSNYKVWY